MLLFAFFACPRSTDPVTPIVPDIAPTAVDEIPRGSGDYAEVLALATRYQRGESTFEQLRDALLGRHLPPHPLGDAYLMTPVPAPPPGTAWDPRQMPTDWTGTWGEVAMAYWLGRLTQDEYDRLHAAAHPDCPP
ncbi:MAG: hypothetical protein ABMB14_23985 [Myxococcota bacterium]